MRNILVFGVRENKSTQNTFSKCCLRVLKLVQINLTSIYTHMLTSWIVCQVCMPRIFQISSPADNPMSELNHAKIDWSRCSRNFIHAKIYPLKANVGQFLTFPLPSDMFMLLSSDIFMYTLFQASKHFRDPPSSPCNMWIIPKEDLRVE